MDYATFQREDRRLVLLRALQAAAQYTANAYLLRRFAESLGHMASADQVEADIAWLAEQALLERSVRQGVTLATLTERGLDVATGAAQVPGVARPQPE